MQYYAAPLIHDGFRFLENKVLVFQEDGTFFALEDTAAVSSEAVQYYEGILLPGLVNAHCHLELSHTKGSIAEHTGLVAFLSKVVQNRNYNADEKLDLIKSAMGALSSSGCIAVGDIANGTDTLALRSSSSMHIHTFVEAMGFVPQGASSRFEYARNVCNAFAQNTSNDNGYEMRQSIVPHAPYSVAPELFQLINSWQKDSLISIHNEECPAENEYFQTKTGAMKNLYANLGINDDWFEAKAQNSLPSYIPYLDTTHPILLVHNTCMDQTDIQALKNWGTNVSLVLCPNANLYIENRLPNVTLLANSGLNICLGTDSLASNHQLNVIEEILTLQRNFPEIGLESLLTWATSNGAKALQLSDKIGSFRIGLKPGLVHLQNNKTKRIL